MSKQRSSNCSCNSCKDKIVTVPIEIIKDGDVHVHITQVEARDPDKWLAEMDAMAAKRAAGAERVTGAFDPVTGETFMQQAAAGTPVAPLGTVSFRDDKIVAATEADGTPVDVTHVDEEKKE